MTFLFNITTCFLWAVFRTCSTRCYRPKINGFVLFCSIDLYMLCMYHLFIVYYYKEIAKWVCYNTHNSTITANDFFLWQCNVIIYLWIPDPPALYLFGGWLDIVIPLFILPESFLLRFLSESKTVSALLWVSSKMELISVNSWYITIPFVLVNTKVRMLYKETKYTLLMDIFLNLIFLKCKLKNITKFKQNHIQDGQFLMANIHCLLYPSDLRCLICIRKILIFAVLSFMT